jgi:DNA-binding CsgD family transcriptional regulator
MLKSHNPYNVLSEIISFENVQQMGELITLKCLRGYCAYSRRNFEKLYTGYVRDLNRRNNPNHIFSDAYDFAQNAICFLCEFIGKELTDIYTIKNGQEITIKRSTYLLVGRTIDRMRRYMSRSRDINDYTEELSVEIDHCEEKDYTEVDNKIELLNLKPRDRAVLDCYMAGMTCNEIAEFLDIDRITVWRRRTRAQVKYKALFF